MACGDDRDDGGGDLVRVVASQTDDVLDDDARGIEQRLFLVVLRALAVFRGTPELATQPDELRAVWVPSSLALKFRKFWHWGQAAESW
jgi:integral membrane sensor domain MASE1